LPQAVCPHAAPEDGVAAAADEPAIGPGHAGWPEGDAAQRAFDAALGDHPTAREGGDA